MKYNCIIIDDEKPARRLIENYCKKTEDLEVIGSYKSSLEAFSILEKNTVDILFLDIQMPDLSGIDFLKTLKNHKVKVILTTAYREYALDGFELDAVDYLLKPIEFHRFLRAVNKVKEKFEKNKIKNEYNPLLEESRETVQLKSNKKLYKVPVSDILYIQSESEYVTYVTKTFGKLMVHGALKDVAAILPQKDFFRIHRSYIVNLTHIKYVEGSRVSIQDNFFPISETYRKDFFMTWK